jgi:hypothetical protein
MIDEDDCGAIGGMKIGRGNRSTRRKPAPAPLCCMGLCIHTTWCKTVLRVLLPHPTWSPVTPRGLSKSCLHSVNDASQKHSLHSMASIFTSRCRNVRTTMQTNQDRDTDPWITPCRLPYWSATGLASSSSSSSSFWLGFMSAPLKRFLHCTVYCYIVSVRINCLSCNNFSAHCYLYCNLIPSFM